MNELLLNSASLFSITAYKRFSADWYSPGDGQCAMFCVDSLGDHRPAVYCHTVPERGKDHMPSLDGLQP